MPTFVWREQLTVSVGEMSRTAALECAREFDVLAQVYTDRAELLRETDILLAVHAPTAVKVDGETLLKGERVIELEDGESIKLVIPLTADCFNALPMSLTEAWVSAAVKSNGWMIEVLKKVMGLASVNSNGQESGNEQSNELTVTLPMMKTIGE